MISRRIRCVHRGFRPAQHLPGGVDDAHFVASVAQSIPAVGGTGVWMSSCFCASSLLDQWGSTRWGAGHARRLLTDRRSVACSPVATWHVLGHRTSQLALAGQATRAVVRWASGASAVKPLTPKMPSERQTNPAISSAGTAGERHGRHRNPLSKLERGSRRAP